MTSSRPLEVITRTNTLAYLAEESVTKKKKFYKIGPKGRLRLRLRRSPAFGGNHGRRAAGNLVTIFSESCKTFSA